MFDSPRILAAARAVCLAVALCLLPHAALAGAKVVASFSILADMARNVAGDLAEVSAIVGPGRDAHTYEPTPADARALAAADLVVVNGLGFEGFLDRLIRASGTKALVVTATRGITPLAAHQEGRGRDHAEHGGGELGHKAHGGAHAEADPHAWQSLANAMIYVENIRQGLVAVDPANAAAYAANAATYAARLRELQSWAEAEFAPIPADRRRILTSHEALGYLARDFGITILSPRGVSTAGDPSAKEMRALVQQIRSRRVAAVFMENIESDKLVRQIAAETGAAVGGVLYPDTLSGPGGPAPDFLGLYRHNVAKIVEALR